MARPVQHLVTLLFTLATAVVTLAATRPPNVIVILVDDFGVTDLSCYGSRLYETPNVDKLAKDGVRFTEGYSACTVCSPTRSALLTGKIPARLHVTDWIPGESHPKAKLKIPDWQKFLPFEEVTLAEQLTAAGYATASIGKWHLTPGLEKGDEAYYPDKHGFDLNIGGYHRGQPPSYFSPYKIPTLVDGPKGEFLTDREAAEAVKFMEANQDKPFFIYLPHYAVHQPLDGKKEVIAKYKAKVDADPTLKQRNATYAALVSSVDDALGTIRAGLKRLHLDDNTIIIFTGDNGGKIGPTDNSPYRVGKGSAYEGGIRVPLIVYWPGVTKPGRVDATPNITHDLYPTVLEMTGIAAQKTVVDGVSLAPLLKVGAKVEREALYWHYPHYHGGGATPHSAIRKGEFRLIHFYEDNRDELYDLAHDIGETKDLAASQPEKAKELRTQLDAYLKSVGAQLPSANPNYDPTPSKAKAPAVKKAAK
ncbi:MAG: sulfatase [Verrucomicrobia bacterium]|nr:sulfatase [Verrucomicrobiota bacterium]